MMLDQGMTILLLLLLLTGCVEVFELLIITLDVCSPPVPHTWTHQIIIEMNLLGVILKF
jgi:hypothetical protein